ncbi:MAG: response regulator [Cyclobacteriaceae bacterium]
MRRSYLLWVGTLFILPQLLFAQYINPDAVVFDQLPPDLGLNQRSINSIIQDQDGYLWIGTWSGLIRYDGYSTKIYQSNSEDSTALQSSKITSLYEDDWGNIWVGTLVGGLYQYHKNTDRFTQYNHRRGENSLSNNNVWDVLRVGQYVWIATIDKLNRLDLNTGTFEHFGVEHGLSNEFITSFTMSQSGHLWVSTSYGLNSIHSDGDQLIIDSHLFTLDQSNSDLHNYMYEIGELDGAIYVSSKKGLKRWDGTRFKNYEYQNMPVGHSFFRSLEIIEGDSPQVLAGSEVGLAVLDLQTGDFGPLINNVKGRSEISHNTITEVFLDRNEVLWVGTKKGLNRYDVYDKGIELFPNELFDPTKSILTGIRSTAGHTWISTIGGGLFRFQKEDGSFQRIKLLNKQETDFTDFIQKLELDNQGNVWLGLAGGGVYQYDPTHAVNRGNEVREYEHWFSQSDIAISDDYIMSLTPSEMGMWVGTWSNGLNHINVKGEVQHFQIEEIGTTPIVELHQTSNILWVGTRGNGLLKLEVGPESVSLLNTYSTAEGNLSNDFVTSIWEDQDGLWVGTEEGLNNIKGDETISYRKSDGLETNEVIGILGSGEKLFLSNHSGITVVNKAGDQLRFVNHFDTEDRVQGGFFYNDVCELTSDGQLYFGGADGFNVIRPERMSKNPNPSEVTLTSVSIFGKDYHQNELLNDRVLLSKSIAQSDTLILMHDENSISIGFSVMHFAAPYKNKYAYRLEGFNDQWQFVDARARKATYTNLKDGTYLLEVKASNNDGVWSDNARQLTIIILPPWWRTPIALTGYLIAFALILLSFRQLIIARTNYINNIKMERMKREHSEQINKAKLQFFTNISHEFRTPLTLILGPLEKLLQYGEGGKYVKDHVNIINRNTQRLLRLVNQLLDFRKVDAGSMQLKVAEGNIVKFIKEIKLSFDTLAEEKNIDFQIHASSNIINLWFDRDQFEKIIFNLLSNSFKYTPTGGNISIKIVEQHEHVRISVEDSGTGIKSEDLDHIFERFYSAEDHHNAGTGIGLALVHNLVELHHGEISATSKRDEGTQMEIKIPLGSTHFSRNEIIADFKDSEHVQHYVDAVAGEQVSVTSVPPNDVADMDKLLIVEDNAEVRSYLRSLFLGKYVVLEAENGQEALDLALEENPQLIVSDVMMPVMDGINLCKKIKSNVKTSHIPVILLTARTSLIFTVEGLEIGADDYITKPFNAQVLELKIANLIKTRKQLTRAFSDNATLEIEPKKVTLTSSDELFVEQALNSVELNMDNSEYGVENLGRDVAMSRMQLYRKLKALTGQSANEFIRTIRLKRAAQLLEQNELTVAEVTYRVGFSDLQYFRQCFKKQFGANPSDYVQNDQGEEVKE